MSSGTLTARQNKPTSPVVTVTNAAFPVQQLPSIDISQHTTTAPSEEPHATEKVVLAACSELSTKHVAPVSLFDGKHRLRLFEDGKSNPILFTVGNDNRLYCLLHVEGHREGWEATDITPGGNGQKVVAFDAAEKGEKLYLAAATVGSDADSPAIVHYMMIEKTMPSTSPGDIPVPFSINAETGWKAVANNLGARKISSLTCIVSEKFLIVSGTERSSQIDKVTGIRYAASHYLIDPSNSDSPWADVPMGSAADKVLQVHGGVIPNKEGNTLFTVYEDPMGDTQCSADVLDENLKDVVHYYNLVLGELGITTAIFPSLNPWGFYDIVVAGSQGIGFFNFKRIDKRPVVVDALKGMSFKQVVCSEYGAPKPGITASTIRILAVSSDNKLYSIEGKRTYKTNTVEFICSGIPIMFDVELLAARFDPVLNASQVCCVSSGSNRISHLYQDQDTGTWQSTPITITSDTKTTTFPAYLTTLKLTNGKGKPVPPEYPVRLSADAPAIVTVNGRTHRLSNNTPIDLKTDAKGSILIVLPASDSLCSTVYHVTLPKYNSDSPDKTYEVHSNQRLIEQLNNGPSENELTTAKDSQGRPLFSASADFTGASQLMKQVPLMQQTIKNNRLASEGSKDFEGSWTVDAKGNVSKDDEPSWMENAVSTIEKFLGDAIQFMKSVVKGVVKFGIRLVKGVSKLLILIGGKPMEFILDTVGSLIGCVVGTVTSLLGSALKAVLEFFGLLPDPKVVAETQKALTDLTLTLMDKSCLMVETNRSTVELGIEKLAAKLRTVIDDKRPALPESSGSDTDSPLSKILDNPFIKTLLSFNPLGWIMEAITEELGDIDIGVKIPSLSPVVSILTDVLPDLLMKELAEIERLFSSIGMKLQDFIDNPSRFLDILFEMLGDAFWTGFDVVKHIVLALYDILSRVLQQIRNLLGETIVIPFISRLFEDMTGMKFTLLNAATYIFANILAMVSDYNPAPSLNRAIESLKNISATSVDLKPRLGIPLDPEAEFIEELRLQEEAQRSGPEILESNRPTGEPTFRLMNNSHNPNDEAAESFMHLGTALTGLSRCVIIICESIGPYADAVHAYNTANYNDNSRRPPPVHMLPETSGARSVIGVVSVIAAGVNFAGHACHLIGVNKHSETDCADITWAGFGALGSVVCFGIELVSACKHKHFKFQNLVVAGVATAASVCQLQAEKDLVDVMRKLHYAGCVAGVVHAVCISAAKAQPIVAIAGGGLSGLADLGVSIIGTVHSIQHLKDVGKHHDSTHGAKGVDEKEEKRALIEG